ncbi:MAG: hypothetical protein WB946_00615, partial [Halobacteriota archaeon]
LYLCPLYSRFIPLRGALKKTEPPPRLIIEALQQAMCAHDAEKLAISLLEVYEERKLPKQPTCYK